MKLVEIEGIGPVYAQKLIQAGIKTPQDILENGHTATKRKELAHKTGISEKQILNFVHAADLLRIKGVGLEFVGLLEEVGVDSSKELSQRDVEQLAKAIREVNKRKKLVRRVPGIKELMRIISVAKEINQAPKGLAGNISTDAPPPPPKSKYGPVIEY